ncbi:hypothetical protein CSKR_107561 [Clonorchis sinensis]|uniref:Uncharacterized protein n=1 Tax=Clonorchis sinensis TaxID=79923 RepID=A0A3R7DAM7_CLOSI|nr:hypothetical protein CSKR_107561 [Clonorchis sinensis]
MKWSGNQSCQLSVVLLCVVIGNAFSANVQSTPAPEKKTQSVDSQAKEAISELQGTQTIIRPTNIFAAGSDLISHDARGSSSQERDLRPFEWLYKHLTEYLICAYGERAECEQKLAHAIRLDELKSDLDKKNNHKPTKVEYMEQKPDFGTLLGGPFMGGIGRLDHGGNGDGPGGFGGYGGPWNTHDGNGHFPGNGHKKGFGPATFGPHWPYGGPSPRFWGPGPHPGIWGVGPGFGYPHVMFPGPLGLHGFLRPELLRQGEERKQEDNRDNRKSSGERSLAGRFAEQYHDVAAFPLVSMPFFFRRKY